MKWATEEDFVLKCIRESKAFAAVTPTTNLSAELRKLASAPTVAPSSVYANACRDAHLEIERLLSALRPFAESPYAAVAGDWDDHEICEGIKVSDLRKARAALSPSERGSQ